MTDLADRWTCDPDQLADAALEAPRCDCPNAVLDLLDPFPVCELCGREPRAAGSLARQFRRAAYARRLQWARGAGLHPRTDFRGLREEVGPNPALPVLDDALSARVESLVDVQGDPFEGLAVAAPAA
jgi:hypothetical protein